MSTKSTSGQIIVLDVTIPALQAIAAEDIERVRLLFGPSPGRHDDVEIDVDIEEADWSLASNVLTLTYRDGFPTGAARYAEVWIYQTGVDLPVKAPSAGRTMVSVSEALDGD